MVIDIRTVRVSGQVVSSAGEPVAEALVALYRQHDGEDAGIYTLGSDAEGGFLIGRLVAGRYRISVRRDGYGTVHEPLDASSDQEGLLFVLEPTRLE